MVVQKNVQICTDQTSPNTLYLLAEHALCLLHRIVQLTQYSRKGQNQEISDPGKQIQKGQTKESKVKLERQGRNRQIRYRNKNNPVEFTQDSNTQDNLARIKCMMMNINSYGLMSEWPEYNIE